MFHSTHSANTQPFILHIQRIRIVFLSLSLPPSLPTFLSYHPFPPSILSFPSLSVFSSQNSFPPSLPPLFMPLLHPFLPTSIRFPVIISFPTSFFTFFYRPPFYFSYFPTFPPIPSGQKRKISWEVFEKLGFVYPSDKSKDFRFSQIC